MPCRAGGLQNGVGPQGGGEAAALRRRCRVLLQLQRLVARVHDRHAPRMPAPLALQLVGVLQARPAARLNPDSRIPLNCSSRAGKLQTRSNALNCHCWLCSRRNPHDIQVNSSSIILRSVCAKAAGLLQIKGQLAFLSAVQYRNRVME